MTRRLLNRKTLAISTTCLALLAGLTVALAHLVPLPERLHQRDATLVTYRDGSPAHLALSPDEKWRVGITLAEVEPRYIEALLALEDQRFFHHPGVDPIAICRAALTNMSHGRVVSGASTITMQLVRVLEPRPRTLSSKVIEAARALQLELRFSKQEILTHYLRFTPYGRNIEGLDAASLAYFGHRADALSNAEIATLLAVPQAPNTRYPRPDHTARLRAGRDQIARELLALGKLDTGEGDHQISAEQAYAQLVADEVPEALLPFPREMPHLASWLTARHPGATRHHTTIDRALQHELERLLQERRADYAARGIHNAAIVAADNDTHEIIGLIGNFDLFDAKHAGQMATFDAPRSTGSLLKPAILTLAMDRGLTHPERLIEDIPITRRTWTPENFTGQFSGLVKLSDALTHSLNIPFILLVEQLSPVALLGVLQQADFRHLDMNDDHYGLGIAVGGVEATPLEVTGLYVAMANEGAYRPLTLVRQPEPRPTTAPRQLWSRGSGWLTNEVLATRERPDLPWRADLPQEGWTIHWKTGTSNGHRDAWSVGFGGSLTVAVWLGNLSNAASPALVGSRAASPLMFDILEARLPPKLPTREAPADELKEVEVCAYSGFSPSPSCAERRTVLAPVHGVAMTPCPFHRRIEVTRDGGEMTRPECRQGRAVEERDVLWFEPEVRPYLGGGARGELPSWAPGCGPLSAEQAPELLTPARSQRILLIPGIPTDRQRVPFQATSAVRDVELSWFVDGEFLGTTQDREQLWWVPTPGEHEVVVQDQTARASRRVVQVERR